MMSNDSEYQGLEFLYEKSWNEFFVIETMLVELYIKKQVWFMFMSSNFGKTQFTVFFIHFGSGVNVLFIIELDCK